MREVVCAYAKLHGAAEAFAEFLYGLYDAGLRPHTEKAGQILEEMMADWRDEYEADKAIDDQVDARREERYGNQ